MALEEIIMIVLMVHIIMILIMVMIIMIMILIGGWSHYSRQEAEQQELGGRSQVAACPPIYTIAFLWQQ